MEPATDGAIPFELRAERAGDGGRMLVWLAGDIDEAERDLIVAELESGETPREIHIEMSQVGFMGSAGLSALIHACRQLEPVDQKVVLVDPSASVVTLLDTCGITPQFILQVHET